MKPIALCLALVGVAVQVSAQHRPINDSSKGEGTYYHGGSGTRNIDRATVRLLNNNQFIITVSGQRTGTFAGTYDMSGSRALLNVKTVNDNRHRVSGRGVINLTGGMQVTSLEMDGEIDRDTFRVRYDAHVNSGGPGWGGGGSNDRDFSGSLRRRGTFTIDGRRSDIASVDVTVRDGKLMIRVKGEKSVDFAGTARRQGQNDYTIRIERGFSRTASGSGSISVRPDGRLRSVDFSGRADGKSYRVQVSD
ncbi:MAG: hypothetical protein H3C58_06880 [Fimbriimonadaceae bacterium]|nr:hypothetical protein [Fimbriimonadaceae bacterium]